MKVHPTQFGMRENTASSRQHASRPSVDTHSNAVCIEEERAQMREPSSQNHRSARGSGNQPHAASQHVATGGGGRDASHLLTVHEVAELLQVPVSWVYGRMRKRSREQLPAYRLGKYWRFREDEVLAWVESQRGDSHAA